MALSQNTHQPNSLLLRPSLSAAWQFTKAQSRTAFVLLMLASAFLRVLAHPETIVLIPLLLAAFAILVPIWLWLNISRTSISVENGIVRWQKVVRHGMFALNDIGGIQWRSMGVRAQGYAVLIVRDRAGRVLLRFDPAWFPLDSGEELESLFQRAIS